MSFQTDIEAYTGSISSLTTEAAKYLKDGVKYITKIVMHDRNVAERLTQSSTLNNSPTTMSTSNALKIVSVTRNDGSRNRIAVEVPVESAGDYLDANSIYYTSKYDPKWYISDGTLNVIPTPAAGQSALVRHITPDSSVAVGDSSIDNFPAEFYDGVIFYAAKNILLKKMVNSAKPNVADAAAASTDLTADITAGVLTTAADNLDFDKWFDVLGDLIADEDIELAQVQTDKIRSYVETYSVAQQSESEQYKWYESQYIKMSELLLGFLEPYIVGRMATGGQASEATANDRPG
tara:strand:- start:436 stop:1311 length:876 start_codon:yes stop_codon:yes gene_type:complete